MKKNINKVNGQQSTVNKVLLSLSLSLSLLFVSCDDFLVITPLNEIVLENYWTEEADVNSVVNSCYAQLESSDCIKRMIIWGELRSDDMTNGASSDNTIKEILKENILETNTFSKWECFYQCINRCNTVLHYAPDVNKIDPNFNKEKLKATMAEATILRSICYFYLIRTFRDVPFVTEPSIDDTKSFVVAPSSFEVVLDSLIEDVEEVAEDAVRSYGENSIENTCRITRWTAYTLLADLYLWKGEYQKCVEYCDKVIDQKIKEYEDKREKDPSSLTIELFGKYPLISETPAGSTYSGNAYEEIFGKGNSFESIFELTFERNKSASNSTISSFYGGRDTNGSISAPNFLFEEAYSGQNKYFKKTDCRYLEYMKESSTKIAITKYVNEQVSFKSTTTAGSAPTVNSEARSDEYPNWIIYRLSDVMLMKAEAEVELAGAIDSLITDEQTSLYQSAFACVSAIWKRANNKRVATTDTLVYSDYATSRVKMEDLVFDERQREFLFEGKRWYDFVRLSRRDQSNSRMIEKVLPKFEENAAAIRIRLSAQDALYWPYAESELKINGFLKQNPAYIKDNGFEM